MKHLMLCLLVMTVLAAPCAAQDPRGPFADVPTGHWAYQDADTLQKAGIMLDEPDRGGSKRPMSWSESAVKIARLLSQLSAPKSLAYTDIETKLIASPLVVAALQDLVLHFKPELANLKVDVASAQARLAELEQTATAAQPQSTGPFTDVPTDHWAYQDVDTMQKAGIVFGYPDGTGGNRRMTRQEFAANTARLLLEIFESPLAHSADLRTRLLVSPSAIMALQDLVSRLKPELILLKVDVDVIQARLAEMAQMASRPLAERPFPNVPGDIQAYEDIDTLYEAGIEVRNPDHINQSGHRPMSRQEVAVKIDRLLTLMSGPPSKARADIETRLLASRTAVTALQDLVSNFQPELSQLHVDVNSSQARLADMAQTAAHPLAAKPFADVPLTHWAASAVETLRVNRILAGYPQGTFTVTE